MLRHPSKQEDVPQALAIANASGYGRAPLITCSIYTGATIHLLAPARQVLVQTDKGVLQFDDRMDGLYKIPIAKVRNMSAIGIDRALGGGLLVRDMQRLTASASQIVAIGSICGATQIVHQHELLTSLGYHLFQTPALHNPPRVLFESDWTTIELWQKSPLVMGK